MRNPKACTVALVIGAASFFAVSVPSSFGAMVDLSTGSTATTVESKTTNSDVDVSDLGIGGFTKFPFHVSISATGGYDDNVTTSNIDKQGSSFVGGNLGIDYQFGSPRTQVDLGIGAGFNYYLQNIQGVAGTGQTNNYDVTTFLKLNVVHKASARLTLSTENYISYQTEPDFSIAQGSNQRGGNYLYANDKLAASYLWAPRFSTTTSYTFGVLHYDDQMLGTFNNYVQNTVGTEFHFLLQPNTSLVLEYRCLFVTYESVNNDSTNHFILGGFDHSFNPRLSVTFRGGVQLREYDAGNSDTSPTFESSVVYVVGKQTNVSWASHYAIEEPNAAFSQGRKDFHTGLTAQHNFTPRISGSLGAYYDHSDYLSAFGVPGFTEESFDLALSVRYGITRYLGIQAGYNYTNVTSDQSLREYDRNRYWGGLNFAF